VILLAANSLPRCGQPEEAEVLACLQGLNLYKENDIYIVVVECDCSAMVERTKTAVSDRS
jgi:hypothetical protein